MGASAGLLRWQWEAYPRNHRNRVNLLLHVVAVPVFLLGNVALLAGLFTVAWPMAGAGALAMVASLGLQGLGHAREAVAPEPFRGPVNAGARILCEQWVTFPRFVLSGGWAKAWRS